MVVKNIALSRTEDNIHYVMDDEGKWATENEEGTEFINFFFFTATSINFTASTMVLEYDWHEGWEPDGCLSICNAIPAIQEENWYCIKITVPKFYSTTQNVEYRNIYARGTIQTDYPTVSSDYNLLITINGCPAPEEYALQYTTEYDYDHFKIRDTDITFNTSFLINRNIEFFENGYYGNGRDEREMLNIVARKVMGVEDSDFGDYTDGYSEETYNPECEPQELNSYIYKDDNILTVSPGFFKIENGSIIPLEISDYLYPSKRDGKIVFEEPLEAIGYHTFFFGCHYNEPAKPPITDGEYICYTDNHGNGNYFSGDGTLLVNNKVKCVPDNTPNEFQYLFNEYENITSIKTGKYLKIIGNQAFKGLKKLSSIDFEGSNLKRIGMNAFEQTFSLRKFDMPLTVELIGEGAFKWSGITGITIPSAVTHIEPETFDRCQNLTEVNFDEESQLKKICTNAFFGCDNEDFSSITFPDSLRSIERAAFAGCTGLDNVVFNDGLLYIGDYGFYDCTNLGSIVIPDSVTGMGKYAFGSCNNLDEITIGSGMTSIGENAFSGCTNLSLVTIDSDVIVGAQYSPNYSLKNIFGEQVSEYIIGGNVTSIGSLAFSGCSMTSITIPNSMTYIRMGAFYDCSNLNSVHITDITAWCAISFDHPASNPLSMAHNLYLNGGLVTDLTIPNSVTDIGAYAFISCDSLTSVTIPTNVISIGMSAFHGCSSLTSVTILNGVTYIGYNGFNKCESLLSIAIPDSVTNMGDYAFQYCVNLESVVFGNGLTIISDYSFEHCASLTSITFSNSVTYIGMAAFDDCKSLSSVTIPNSVTYIGMAAFYDCTSLTAITCEAETPPSVDGGAFDNTNNCPIYVPAASVNAYQTASGWSSYASRIQAI